MWIAIAILGALGVFAPDILVSLGKVLIIIATNTVKLVYWPRKSLQGEIALVTGAGSGIGRLMSLILVKEGITKIVLWDINREAVEKVAEECRKAGSAQVFTGVCDVSKKEAIYEAAEKVKKETGDVTILINNAGIVTGKKFLDCPDALMEKTMYVNTISHFWTVKAFLPSMLTKNHGHVVTIASTAGTVGVSGLVDYCASKFGAFGFDESLRMELYKMGKDGIHTTCVCPYFISTGMFDGCNTRFGAILPILTPEYVASRVIDAMRINQEVLVLPRFCYLVTLVRFLVPTAAFDEILRILGIPDSMDSFHGRPQAAK
eukprot:TRINITY_DN11221_c0_g1::TRINITY_DN11221_c0_g1_i1::g.604::m.604 TRINITY_DN11221_c0_g1::TRINITY_DN11221_c0_g1_i1::g.604  ORF type:complete len:328 (+),score=86.09,sp/Q7TQA3/RDHE2_MOUSE/47.83/6e-97,adh_short/PF00106.20/6.5e-30,KR/PF08659.5/1e-12,adh_short_C2/PF13561.1/6.1e-09,Polysacc_synt_2/PF02719.10/0.0014,Ldh_1_N/PF00056.18/0.018,Shikimate_DH/PF01488.15/0.029,CbiX/PF01903.12/14,CbiX/PF01903.12/12,Methyltransf_31/PF13847.1/0.21 TRINITY_DN11221_c0_g1_i1:33-986(+)